MSKREREPAISGDEQDWVSGWRHVLKVFDNWTGLGKQVKRKMNKRARRRTKRELSGNPGELESEGGSQ